ncbi:hypothetical protein NC653_017488 [Populus alba x Populus x berolinensis]|uniref:Uncharacterized protein n=1 Tax=Populus alba x Populus x berolinensis TaxID=444605 RepID=A0AAD6QR76_9ROSI|nr:hypothetical protein NC653_017488 [Populus alba x Populus x berolinensis]
MTPAYLYPASSSFPFVDLREEQNLQLFLSPHQAATSLSGPTHFFNTSAHDHQRETKPGESRLHDNQEARTTSFNCIMISNFHVFVRLLFFHVISTSDRCREVCGARTSFSY